MLKALKHCILGLIGGSIYIVLELIFRGHTHISMLLVGGVSFIIVGMINDDMSWDTALWKQMLLGGFSITVVEFVSGWILNIILGLEVWDYSNLPLNLYGQVCIPFFLLWVLLSAVAIVLDDYLRYWLFKEDKPRYKLT